MAKRRPSARLEEVTDLQAEAAPSTGLNLEAGLVFTTFIGLIVGLILAQMALKKYFGSGMMS